MTPPERESGLDFFCHHAIDDLWFLSEEVFIFKKIVITITCSKNEASVYNNCR